MSLLAFPTSKNPQFYVSKEDGALDFFISHFLFSGKPPIQLLINIIKKIIPQPVIIALLKLLLQEKPMLPGHIAETVEDLKLFISKNTNTFTEYALNLKDISCLIRLSKWTRTYDKYVIIFIDNKAKLPLSVAKVNILANRRSVEKEFTDTQAIHCIFSSDNLVLIPKPIALHESGFAVTLFESALKGIPFNDYLKTIFDRKDRIKQYIKVLDKCKDVLVRLQTDNGVLRQEDFNRYFYEPIHGLLKSDFGARYKDNLLILKLKLDSIENATMNGVFMHGDLWPGSILYDLEHIAIIDWEFFTARGIPLWDFFSMVFHIGSEVDYFQNSEISRIIDSHLLDLADRLNVSRDTISVLFESYLIYNIKKRDTEKERYWQKFLESYWIRSGLRQGNSNTLL